jgi:hypothetical protein
VALEPVVLFVGSSGDDGSKSCKVVSSQLAGGAVLTSPRSVNQINLTPTAMRLKKLMLAIP